MLGSHAERSQRGHCQRWLLSGHLGIWPVRDFGEEKGRTNPNLVGDNNWLRGMNRRRLRRDRESTAGPKARCPPNGADHLTLTRRPAKLTSLVPDKVRSFSDYHIARRRPLQTMLRDLQDLATYPWTMNC